MADYNSSSRPVTTPHFERLLELKLGAQRAQRNRRPTRMSPAAGPVPSLVGYRRMTPSWERVPYINLWNLSRGNWWGMQVPTDDSELAHFGFRLSLPLLTGSVRNGFR